jgi:hypothetical protein
MLRPEKKTVKRGRGCRQDVCVGKHRMSVSGEPDKAELDNPLALEYGERHFGAQERRRHAGQKRQGPFE